MKLFLITLNLLLLTILGIRAVPLNIYSNTFNATLLGLSALLIGAILGFFIAKKNDDIAQNKDESSFDHDEFEQYKLYATCIVVSMITCFILSFNINYLISFSDYRSEKIFVEDIQPFIKARGGVIVGEKLEPTGYHVFFKKENKLERLRIAQLNDYEQLIHNDMAFTFRKGLLGFDCFYPQM
jgi:hypothetical protein